MKKNQIKISKNENGKTQYLTEVLPEKLLKSLKLPSLAESLRTLHNPPPELSMQTLADGAFPAWQRLKFDELLAQQLSMRLARQRRKSGNAKPLIGNGVLSKKLLANLPFRLTHAQQRVCDEIRADLANHIPMHRLLQGDVGSGKTIVAALSALVALECEGVQVAIMAPTEILAEQHFIKFKQWFETLGIRVAWLSGSLKKKAKDEAKGMTGENLTTVIIFRPIPDSDLIVILQIK